MTGDSEMYFQYKTIVNNDSQENYSSVGIENWFENDGIEYTHDNFYPSTAAILSNNRALKVTTNTGRGGISGNVELNTGGFNAGVTVSASSGQKRTTEESGDFWIKDVPTGSINVNATIDGYFPQTIMGVTVNANATTENVQFNLTACPVPANLDASEGLTDRVELTWDAVTHADLVGYNIYRADWELGEYEKLNTNPEVATTFTDNNIAQNAVYWYYVTAAFTGSYGDAESNASNKDAGSGEIISGVDDENTIIPDEFFVSQNYPNPFNPTTTFSYGLPSNSNVRIEIFNVLGQSVRVLLDDYQSAGYQSITWDGLDNSGSQVTSGVYFYKINAGEFNQTKKMLMIK
jgi:hypothetical protein